MRRSVRRYHGETEQTAPGRSSFPFCRIPLCPKRHSSSLSSIFFPSRSITGQDELHFTRWYEALAWHLDDDEEAADEMLSFFKRLWGQVRSSSC